MSSDRHGSRAAKVLERAAERDLDGHLVTDLVNVRWLTGLRASNAACICTRRSRILLTDFRYAEAAGAVEGWEVVVIKGGWLKGIAAELRRLAADEGVERIGFEDDRVTVRVYRELESAVELVAAGGLVERLRRAKDPEEVAVIARASELCDGIYMEAVDRGLQGRSEADVSRFVKARIRELGAEPSFEPIIAGGPNGALPHAVPGDRIIAAGDLLVFDMGVELDGMCSDCTRTYAIGRPDAEAIRVYETVLSAQAAALEALGVGVATRDVDAAAREVIEAAGYGDSFGHGLGHGVGMEVHEEPRLSPQSDQELVAGDVVTLEPGIYLPGKLGVRIEDLVVVGDDGVRNLSTLPKELTIVE